MPERRSRRAPSEANFVDLVRSEAGVIKAGLQRQARKPRIVLHSADAFFGDGHEKLAIAHDARRRIVHSAVVQADRYHREISPLAERRSAVTPPAAEAMIFFGPKLPRHRHDSRFSCR